MSERQPAAESASAPLRFSAPDDGEELARAEVYGLLAGLYHAPPSADLYEQLRVAVTEAPARGAFLEASWSELVAASRRQALAEVTDEYTALFGGVGKPEVFLYASWFIAGHLNEKPLAELRRELGALGLERPAGVVETEDHIAALCEVMRYLIAGDDAGVSNLATQQRFFDAHLRPWVERLCDAIRDITEPPAHLTITQSETMVVLTGPDGRTTRLATDGQKVKDENTKMERKTKWDGGKLVSEISGLGPGKMTQTFSVDPEHHQLRITVLMEGGRSGPRTIAQVYEPEPR